MLGDGKRGRALRRHHLGGDAGYRPAGHAGDFPRPGSRRRDAGGRLPGGLPVGDPIAVEHCAHHPAAGRGRRPGGLLVRLAQSGVRLRQGNRHDGPAAARGRSCRSARVGDVPAVSGTEAGPGCRRDARQADCGIPAATSRSPGYLTPRLSLFCLPSPAGSPDRRARITPSPASTRPCWLPRQAAAAPPPAPHSVDRATAGTRGLVVDTHRGGTGPVGNPTAAIRGDVLARWRVPRSARHQQSQDGYARMPGPVARPGPASPRPARCAWPSRPYCR